MITGALSRMLVAAAFFLLFVGVNAQTQTIVSLGETIVVDVTLDPALGLPTTIIIETLAPDPILESSSTPDIIPPLSSSTLIDPFPTSSSTPEIIPISSTISSITPAVVTPSVITPAVPAPVATSATSEFVGSILDYSEWYSVYGNSPTTTPESSGNGALSSGGVGGWQLFFMPLALGVLMTCGFSAPLLF